VLPWSALETIAARIAPLGWHINLQLDGHGLARHEAVLNRLPCRLVIDHLGKFLGPLQPDSEGWLALRRLLDGGRCWIKLSAPYESSLDGPPHYADRAPRVRELAEDFPERGLWASNWPHPNIVPTPDDATLLGWALAQIDSAATRRRILVDNPAELYGF
jgi:D-galactarolactone isomerase